MRQDQLVRNVFKLDGNAMDIRQILLQKMRQLSQVFLRRLPQRLSCPSPATPFPSKYQEANETVNYSITSASKDHPTYQASLTQTSGPGLFFKRVTKTRQCDKHWLR